MSKRRHSSEPQAAPLEGKSGARVVKIRKTGNTAPFLCCCSCKTGVAWFDHHIPYDLDKQDSSNRSEILFTGAFNLYTGEAEIRSSRRLEAASKVAVVDLANIYCAGCKTNHWAGSLSELKHTTPSSVPGSTSCNYRTSCYGKKKNTQKPRT